MRLVFRDQSLEPLLNRVVIEFVEALFQILEAYNHKINTIPLPSLAPGKARATSAAQSPTPPE